jgi:hypothetical protein
VRGTDFASGDRIEIHRLGPRRTLVVVHGRTGARAQIGLQVKPRGEGDSPRDLRAFASRIALYPGAAPPRSLRAHGLPTWLPSVVRSPFLVADGNVEIQQHDPTGLLLVAADGDRFAMDLERSNGFIAGTPAVVHYRTGDTREVIGRATRIRFAAPDFGDRSLRLLADPARSPQLELRGLGGESSFRDIRLVAAGDIDADSERVVLQGPVRARGLDADGEIDPRGIDFSALGVTLFWDSEVSQIERVVAAGDARVAYRDILARGDRVVLHVPQTIADVIGGDEPASVTTGRLRFLGDQFRLNYATGEVQVWKVRGEIATGRNDAR